MINGINGAHPERAILVGIYPNKSQRLPEEQSLQELEELACSAGAHVVRVFLQKRARPDPAYLVGIGKLEKIRNFALNLQANLVVFDVDLTPAQVRNLERFLEIKIIDRTELILDIFSQRAHSREGKLQVELAQLEYLLPRLTGRGVALSRLGGGIGTRGPGETKLEVNRRTIRVRLSRIKTELKKLVQRRSLQRRKRQGVPIPTVSLVGYTNAGKTTLFNQLSGENTLVSARMFATLDPLVRKVSLKSSQEILVSDTVGFLRRLPLTLVAAFRATLEEALEADVIVHVIDISSSNYQAHRHAVYQVLEDIGLEETPILEVYNKIDLMSPMPKLDLSNNEILVSAKTGQGVSTLLEKLVLLLKVHNLEEVHLTIPFERGEVISELRDRGCVESQEFREDGVHLHASLHLADLGRYRQFINHTPPCTE